MLNHINVINSEAQHYFFVIFTTCWYFFPSTYVLQLHIWYCDTNGVLGQSSEDVLASNKL